MKKQNNAKTQAKRQLKIKENKSLGDFFTIPNNKIINDQATSKPSINIAHSNLTKVQPLQYKSKHFFNELKMNIKERLDEVDYEKIILINDNTFQMVVESFSLFNERLEKTLILKVKEIIQITSKNENSIYCLKDFKDNSILKFILQYRKNMIYLPISYFPPFDAKNLENQSLVKLMEGIDNRKHISLMYDSLNYKEIPNKDLAMLIYNFIKNYHKRVNKKALIIYSPENDVLSSIAIVEGICNELNYKILKIDELDKTKALSLNSISEATRTKRINSAKDYITEKLMIVDTVLRNNKTLYNKMFPSDNNFNSNVVIENNPNNIKANITKNKRLNKLKGNTTTSDTYNINININLNSNNLSDMHVVSNITSNININSSTTENQGDDKIYSLTDNIIKRTTSNKNLILIIENSATNTDGKSYFSNLSKEASQSRTPMIVITSTLDLKDNSNEKPIKNDKCDKNDKSEHKNRNEANDDKSEKSNKSEKKLNLNNQFLLNFKYLKVNASREKLKETQVRTISKCIYVLSLHVFFQEIIESTVDISPESHLIEISDYIRDLSSQLTNKYDESEGKFKLLIEKLSYLTAELMIYFDFEENSFYSFIHNILKSFKLDIFEDFNSINAKFAYFQKKVEHLINESNKCLLICTNNYYIKGIKEENRVENEDKITDLQNISDFLDTLSSEDSIFNNKSQTYEYYDGFGETIKDNFTYMKKHQLSKLKEDYSYNDYDFYTKSSKLTEILRNNHNLTMRKLINPAVCPVLANSPLSDKIDLIKTLLKLNRFEFNYILNGIYLKETRNQFMNIVDNNNFTWKIKAIVSKLSGISENLKDKAAKANLHINESLLYEMISISESYYYNINDKICISLDYLNYYERIWSFEEINYNIYIQKNKKLKKKLYENIENLEINEYQLSEIEENSDCSN